MALLALHEAGSFVATKVLVSKSSPTDVTGSEKHLADQEKESEPRTDGSNQRSFYRKVGEARSSDLESQDGRKEVQEGYEGSTASYTQGSTSAVSSDVAKKKDVFLNLEVLNAHQHQFVQALWVFNLAFAICIYAVSQWLYSPARSYASQVIAEKREASSDVLNLLRRYLEDELQNRLYISVAAYCAVLVLPMSAWAAYRLVKTRAFSWTRRQRYLVTVSFLKLGLQSLAVVFWIIPNALPLGHSCRYFSHLADASFYIRWTCINSVLCLQVIHTWNCSPALKKTGRHSDYEARIGDPKLKYEGQDPMVLDAPFLRQHWFLLIWWAMCQSSIIYLAAAGGIKLAPLAKFHQPAPAFCAVKSLPAVQKLHSDPVFWVFAIWSTIYLVLTAFVSRAASIHLRTQSYTAFQFANQLMMWQRRQSVYTEALAIADVSMLYASCTMIGYLSRWYGQPTLLLLLTTITALDAFYMLPMEPSNEEHVYNAWLQQFVWVKKELQPRMSAILKQSPTMGRVLGSRPIFCMETALKLLVWSTVVYEHATVEEDMPELNGHDRITADSNNAMLVQREDSQTGQSEHESILASRPDLDLDSPESHQRSDESSKTETMSTPTDSRKCELDKQQYLSMAMNMYNLTNMKVITGPLTDTKAIIAWNFNTVVLAFRGTSSLKNVRSDAKAWRAYHEPRRGNYWLGKAPMVHSGFQLAWQEIKEAVMDQLATIVSLIRVPNHLLRIELTGHSLGGALANLACWDIQQKYHFPDLTCYTFGAPRIGNKALATEFNSLVPNLYHIINDSDAVPRSGKFLKMYKRPGQRVLINPRGDIRVRPTIFEINLYTSGFSVKQHLLKAYLDSLSAICVAQFFKTKTVKGGLKGVTRLAKSDEICSLLKSNGIDLRHCLTTPELDLMKSMKTAKVKKGKARQNLTLLMQEFLASPFQYGE